MQFRSEMEEAEQSRPLELERVMIAECRYEQSDIWQWSREDMKSAEEFAALQTAIIFHMWNPAGEDE